MARHAFVPLRVQDGCLTIAVAAPHDVPALDQLERLLGKELAACGGAPLGHSRSDRISQKGGQMVARVKEEFRPVLVQENEQGEEIFSRITDSENVIRVLSSSSSIRSFSMPCRSGQATSISSRPTGYGGEISDRRHSVFGHGSVGHPFSQFARVAHQSHVRTGYRGATSAPRRTFQAAHRQADDRFPRVHHSSALASRSSSAFWLEKNSGPARRGSTSIPWGSRGRPRQAPTRHYRLVRHGVGDRSDRQRQDDDALCCI